MGTKTPNDLEPTRAEVEEMFARRREAHARLDAETLAADYAEDATIESPFTGVHSGPAAAQDGLQRFYDTFRGLTMHTHGPIIDGHRVALLATVTATGVNEFMGLPAGDRVIRFGIAIFCELRGLKIRHERRIYDSTGIWVQMGVLKVKPS